MYFLREQGYPGRLSKIAQGNEAAQSLERREDSHAEGEQTLQE